MTDDERIASIEAKIHHENGEAKISMGVLSYNEVDFLIALARIGDAVQPRPISEADPMLEDQQYYTVVPGQGVFSVTWYAGAKTWKTHALSKHEVKFFYDLSALPKPQEPT